MQLSANPTTTTQSSRWRSLRSEEEAARIVDDLVVTLAKMRRNASLALALDVGALIVDRVFGGELKAVHERGKRDTTFRMLGAHPRVPFSASTLWRHVRVYELVRRLPWLMRSRLTITHMQAVLGLDHEQQEHLLRLAESEAWSSARLRQHVRAAGEQARKPCGNHPVIRTFHRFVRLQNELDPESFASLVGDDLAERQRVLATLNRTRAWCDTLEQLLADDPTPRH